ncbi:MULTISPECIES: FGGY-family carbohydrate kinase [Pseudothermotoga]|uniref:Carbohydrate kinase FGGY n=1 Tax=Pseudothermotoga lettingae (strain ATCC BAA-301 / DSM 14385 / NBRC 107922 / TMO) TaxID=416591 RepID=A8F745_PSELT|nr:MULTISPECIES: FGGY-family carbohydrate kinase [Pseudothermotoga]ABV33979.1 carbohydrate kinase FGGY [Pseudothermotoga lettingae TMO]MDK2884604.1 xylulokinase [Pseudothermotoga sp.]GLI49082.1 sugar kinase [Pseudothermotoga lettingae TMO]
MGKTCLLGVDVGTYSSKGVLVDLDGNVLASHVVPHQIEIPKPGFVEHDPEKVWWNDFVVIVRNLMKATDVQPKNIIGIGTSGIGPCVLPVDKDGKPLRKAILYGVDTRAGDEIDYLEEVLGEKKILSLAGSKLTSQAAGPKVLWIRRNEPEVYSKARWFLTSQSYIIYKLTGKPAIDIYSAAGYAPLFDVFNRKWVDEMEMIVSTKMLPEAFWSHEIVGRVTSTAASETGLSEGTPVVAGTTDAAAEAISAGVSQIGDMMLMLGSSVFFIVRTPKIIMSENFWSSNFMQENTFAALGGMSTGGSLITWFRDQFGQIELEMEKNGKGNAFEELSKLASNSPKGARGIIVLPYFAGERTPINDPEAKGIFFGLTLQHTRGDLIRAILESIAYGIRHNFEVMTQEGIQPRRVILAGGGLKNPLLTQLIADICTSKLNIPNQQIGASYGDAFLAAIGVGVFKNIEAINNWIEIQGAIEPDLSFSDIYEIKYRLFRELYSQTKALMHDVHNLQVRLSDQQLS